jgi:hypothetical protein
LLLDFAQLLLHAVQRLPLLFPVLRVLASSKGELTEAHDKNNPDPLDQPERNHLYTPFM